MLLQEKMLATIKDFEIYTHLFLILGINEYKQE